MARLPEEYAAHTKIRDIRFRDNASLFQSSFQPKSIVDLIYESGLSSDPVLSASAQWRLDLPEGKSITNKELRSYLSIIETILTRGTMSYCSPDVEKYLYEQIPGFKRSIEAISEKKQIWQIKNLIGYALENPISAYEASDFDSDLEKEFFSFLTAIPNHTRWSCIEQIEFNSLVETGRNDKDFRRVDFLLSRPGQQSIVVEIDGAQHQFSQETDARRDKLLQRENYHIIRIPSAELRNNDGPKLQEIRDLFSKQSEFIQPDAELLLGFQLSKLIHHAQLALLQAIKNGILKMGEDWNIAVHPPSTMDPEVFLRAIQVSMEDFKRIFEKLDDIYGFSGDKFKKVGNIEVEIAANASRRKPDAIFCFDSKKRNSVSNAPELHISNISLPFRPTPPMYESQVIVASEPCKDAAEWFLQYIFRKPEFWEGQFEAITRTLQGKDSVVLLPTGAGKSIVFQLSGLLRTGRSIVVAPILALMFDQIDNLYAYGIDRVHAISSEMSNHEMVRNQNELTTGFFILTYISPERLTKEPFRSAIRTLTKIYPISQIAVDEAHCVSQWGHDFRAAYLVVGKNSRGHASSNGLAPPVSALTGTASKLVLEDVRRELSILETGSVITPSTFIREELEFHSRLIRPDDNTQKTNSMIDNLFELLEKIAGDFGFDSVSSLFSPSSVHPGIVFCRTVRGPYGVAEVANQIKKKFGIHVGIYSGITPPNYFQSTWSATKKKYAHRFKRDDSMPILAATSSFGMGVDKSNVRFTVHYGLPSSIESFYQEAGRAGRDKQDSICQIIVKNSNPERSKYLLDPSTSAEDVKKMVESPKDRDSVTTALWLHTRSYEGPLEEIKRADSILELLEPINATDDHQIPWDSDSEKQKIEKAVVALSRVGVISDYTMEGYAKGHCVAKTTSETNRETIANSLKEYIATYNRELAEKEYKDLYSLPKTDPRDFAKSAVTRLINFMYENVEKQRRRALDNMLSLTELDSKAIRERIGYYLQRSEFDELLDDISDPDAHNQGINKLIETMDLVSDYERAESLRGTSSRFLESYATQPTLLMLRGMAEACVKTPDQDTASRDFHAGLTEWITQYQLSFEDLTTSLVEFLIYFEKSKPKIHQFVIDALLTSSVMNRDLARKFALMLPKNTSVPFMVWLAQNLAKETGQFTQVR